MILNPSRASARSQCAVCLREVSDSANALLDKHRELVPRRSAISQQIRSIEAAVSQIVRPAVPIMDIGYHECLELLIAESKVLSCAPIPFFAKLRRLPFFSRLEVRFPLWLLKLEKQIRPDSMFRLQIARSLLGNCLKLCHKFDQSIAYIFRAHVLSCRVAICLALLILQVFSLRMALLTQPVLI